MDIGSHTIDLARYLVGDIDEVCGLLKTAIPERPLPAKGTNLFWAKSGEDAPMGKVEVDDLASFMVRFHNGAVGTLEASRVASGKEDGVSFVIWGTKGAIRWNQQQLGQLEVSFEDVPVDEKGFKTIEIAGVHNCGIWNVPFGIGLGENKAIEIRDVIDAVEKSYLAKAPEEKDTYKIAYVTKRWSGSEHWITVKNGIDAAVADYGNIRLEFVDCEGDMDTQLQTLEDVVAKEMDAIICSPRDPSAIVASYEMIHEAGIPLIGLDCSSNAPEFETTTVKMDYRETGRLCGEALIKAMGESGKVILYYDFPNVEANERADGIKAVLEQYPNIKVVEADGFGTVDEALLKVEDAFIANPDVTAFWGYNSQVAQAAISLLESMEMDCLVTCVDATSIEVENIINGRMLGSAAQFPYDMGYTSVKAAMDVLSGKEVEHTMLLGTEWVDINNVYEYAEKMGIEAEKKDK